MNHIPHTLLVKRFCIELLLIIIFLLIWKTSNSNMSYVFKRKLPIQLGATLTIGGFIVFINFKTRQTIKCLACPINTKQLSLTLLAGRLIPAAKVEVQHMMQIVPCRYASSNRCRSASVRPANTTTLSYQIHKWGEEYHMFHIIIWS